MYNRIITCIVRMAYERNEKLKYYALNAALFRFFIRLL